MWSATSGIAPILADPLMDGTRGRPALGRPDAASVEPSTYEVRGPLRDVLLCHCVECRRVERVPRCVSSATRAERSRHRRHGDCARAGSTARRATADARRGFCGAVRLEPVLAGSRQRDAHRASRLERSTGRPGLRIAGHIYTHQAGDFDERSRTTGCRGTGEASSSGDPLELTRATRPCPGSTGRPTMARENANPVEVSMSEKMWGGEPFWGLGYEWDPDWVLTDRQKELRATAHRALREGDAREREALGRRAALPAPQPRAARRARLPRAHRPRGVRRPRREPRRLRDDVRDDRALRLRVDGDVLRDAHRRGERDHVPPDRRS